MASQQTKNFVLPLIIIGILYFILGFVTWINGALIPFMKTINELTDAQSYLVASASYISFVVMALPASYVINKVGYRKGMSLGLALMAAGALVFIPAAEARTYWVFLTGIFIQGTGMTILQTAINPYVTILGPIDSAAKRISLMGICNKTAGALGSFIFGALLLSGIDDIKQKLTEVSADEKVTLLNEMADSVVVPYITMAIALGFLSLLIIKASLPHVEAADNEEADAQEGASKKTSIFQFPHLWLGVLALFVYVGVEVIAGDTIISYGLSLGMPGEKAKSFTLMTLFAMVGTYGIGALLIPRFISQKTALTVSAILGIVFGIGIVSTTGFVSVLFVAALGIANALVWPSIWPLALNGLGKFTKTASALLVMAISGGAIIPPLYGLLVDSKKAEQIGQGVEQAVAQSQAATSSYWILFPCYAIILYYALHGHKVGLKK
ncbi:sugar MFS transporter [Marinilongibacter aquaticus]|uniref:sugar MFS transporter n=1 Tax=Marinilongibacter aquaticus TaxID=2975157 RepID=UPI0021BDBC31|nr:sugar MFS transporter [Marinilongibacter aquaticus]UBM59688.1 sugar MFS transporter [Marinilongibacter aquaticus]